MGGCWNWTQLGLTTQKPQPPSALPLAGFEQVGDEVAQAPAFKVRSLLQVLVQRPVEGEGDSLRSPAEQICNMQQLGRR